MNFWIFCGGAIASFVFLLSYIELAKDRGLVDRPGERRNHVGNVVRGGGFVVVICSLISAIAYVNYNAPHDINISRFMSIVALALFLAFIFFLEDARGLKRRIRFAAQIFSAILGTYICQDRMMIFPGAPYIVNAIIVTIGWIWFMNLYNFMDGIDGMTSSNTIFFCIAVYLLGAAIGLGEFSDIMGICFGLFAAILPFAIINWHPAKVFIGDSGSIAIGFIMGYVFLSLSHYVGLLIPIILCSYYLFDASITLILRILNHENILEPHSKHFFQIAVRGGLSHSRVCIIIACFNFAFLMLGYLLLFRNTVATTIFAWLSMLILNCLLLHHFVSTPRRLRINSI